MSSSLKINTFSNLSLFIERFFSLPPAADEKPIGGQKGNISDHWIGLDKRIEILKVTSIFLAPLLLLLPHLPRKYTKNSRGNIPSIDRSQELVMWCIR